MYITRACTSNWADNYDAQATIDDGMVLDLGCTSIGLITMII